MLHKKIQDNLKVHHKDNLRVCLKDELHDHHKISHNNNNIVLLWHF